MNSNSEKRVIVCLCGSTKFKTAFEQAHKQETAKGKIVLTVESFSHADKIDLDPSVKKRLDDLHFYKILCADEVLILNVGGYIGWSTVNELDYAKFLGRKINYLEGGNDV